MTTRAAIVVIASLLLVKAGGETEARSDTVRVDVQMVSVPLAAGLELVPAFRDEKTIERAVARVQGMLARDEAALLGWPVVWVRSGERAKSGTNEELRSETTFQPAAPPQNFIGGYPVIVNPTKPKWGPHIPIAIDTDYLGSSLEVEPNVADDGHTIGISIAAQFRRFIGYRAYRGQASPIGIRAIVQRPDFAGTNVTTTLSVRSGRPVLLGVFVMHGPDPHLGLFILRATVADAGQPLPSSLEK